MNQDAFQATNDFHLYKKNHDITFGASFESFKFGNSFNLTGYGPTLFFDGDIADFKAKVPAGLPYVFGAYPLDVDVNVAKAAAAADQWTWYYLTVGQLAAYLQDEWQTSSKFKLTYGVRIDKPVYFEDQFKYVAPDGKESSPNGSQ